MSIHRMSLPVGWTPEPADGECSGSVGELVWIEGDEAHHAYRVKRLEVGSAVELIDGQGLVCRGTIEVIEKRPKTRAGGGGSGGGGWRLGVKIEEIQRVEPGTPSVELCVAVPKGERFETMVAMVSQVGVATVRALESRRAVSDPRPGKLERIRRIAAESAKQCGRAWSLLFDRSISFAEAIKAEQGGGIILADASGGEYLPTGRDPLRVLIGPEGGWSEEELELAVRQGVQVARFGEHVMRIETAAVVVCSAVLIAEHAARRENPA